MKQSILLTLILFHFAFLSMGQKGDKTTTKFDKVYSLVDNNKYSEADEYLVKLINKEPHNAEAWDLLAKIRYNSYSFKKKLSALVVNATLTSTNKDGKEETTIDDSLTNLVSDVLSKVDLSKDYYDKYIYTLKRALLNTPEALYCDISLRNELLDVNVDSNISEKALDAFGDAEKEFGNRNYNQAAKYYKKALDYEPNFYKAALYLGDCYYMIKDYANAIDAFKEASNKQPNLLEPVKYLCDAYAYSGMLDKAKGVAIKGICLYPDRSMFEKLVNILKAQNQSLNIEWTAREVFPIQNKTEENKYIIEDSTYKDNCWSYYNKALQRIKPYVDENGIINENPITKERYLEVFAWKEMLKSSNSPVLKEARKMDSEGYLDCYVLVTCFHYDLLSQFMDLKNTNKDHIRDYLNHFISSK